MYNFTRLLFPLSHPRQSHSHFTFLLFYIVFVPLFTSLSAEIGKHSFDISVPDAARTNPKVSGWVEVAWIEFEILISMLKTLLFLHFAARRVHLHRKTTQLDGESCVFG
jgi:hypothetical protein